MPEPSPAIEEATVMYGKTARIGDRVKHYGQRWTGCATATVVGFRCHTPGWVKVLVEPDKPTAYGESWDWDRTEIAPDPRNL